MVSDHKETAKTVVRGLEARDLFLLCRSRLISPCKYCSLKRVSQ